VTGNWEEELLPVYRSALGRRSAQLRISSRTKRPWASAELAGAPSPRFDIW